MDVALDAEIAHQFVDVRDRVRGPIEVALDVQIGAEAPPLFDAVDTEFVKHQITLPLLIRSGKAL